MYLSDMESHDHVTHDQREGFPRCSWVELQGEWLSFVLDVDRRYDPHRAECHLRFLNLRTDENLVRFTRLWGPLMTEDVWRRGNEFGGKTRCSLYWAFQAALTAQLELVQSFRFRNKEGLETALLKYITAADGWSSTITLRKVASTARELSRLYTGHDCNPQDWIPKANISRLREVAAWCLGYFSLEFRLSATWQAGKPQMAWEPYTPTLAQAIQWEVWNSLTGARPVTICEECRTVFAPDSAHPRKFCSYPCAHRVAMRMSRKNNAESQPPRKKVTHAKAKKA
jgi:hypothetical protein